MPILLLMILGACGRAGGTSPPSGAGIRVLGSPPMTVPREAAEHVREVAGRLGLGPRDTVVFHPDAVAKGRLTGDASEAHIVPGQRTVHLLLAEGLEPYWDLALARLAAEGLTPAGSSGWLARGMARRMLGADLASADDRLAAALKAGDVLPPLAEILGARTGARQPETIFGPAASSFVGFLRREAGERGMLRIASSEDPAAELARLGGMAALEKRWTASMPGVRPARRRDPGIGFMKGVNLAMLNNLASGYQSAGCSEVLDDLARLGAEWVAVTPFGFSSREDSPRIRIVLSGLHAETDAAMRHVMREARARGLRVFYKPHLWLGNGEWVGRIAMRTEEDWRLWFDDYRRFAVHHAILAAGEGAEMFSVGNELSATTGRARDWIRVIEAVRYVYPGLVTYAANWGAEFADLPFTGSLDAVGLSAYYPLSQDPEASDAQLRAGARSLRDRIESGSRRWNRKVIVTEIGYPSTERPWMRPYEERRGPAALEAQARCYRAVLGELRGSEHLAGIFWWKVESSPRHGGAADTSFTFAGKPAERVLGEAWKQGERTWGIVSPGE